MVTIERDNLFWWCQRPLTPPLYHTEVTTKMDLKSMLDSIEFNEKIGGLTGFHPTIPKSAMQSIVNAISNSVCHDFDSTMYEIAEELGEWRNLMSQVWVRPNENKYTGEYSIVFGMKADGNAETEKLTITSEIKPNQPKPTKIVRKFFRLANKMLRKQIERLPAPHRYDAGDFKIICDETKQQVDRIYANAKHELSQPEHAIISDKMDWYSGDFSDHNSCFTNKGGLYRSVRYLIDECENNELFVIKFFNEFGDGSGRCIVACISGRFVLFNAYGYPLESFAIFLANYLGEVADVELHKGEILLNVSHDGIYINHNKGIILSESDQYIGSSCNIDLTELWIKYGVCPRCSMVGMDVSRSYNYDKGVSCAEEDGNNYRGACGRCGSMNLSRRDRYGTPYCRDCAVSELNECPDCNITLGDNGRCQNRHCD